MCLSVIISLDSEKPLELGLLVDRVILFPLYIMANVFGNRYSLIKRLMSAALSFSVVA